MPFVIDIGNTSVKLYEVSDGKVHKDALYVKNGKKMLKKNDEVIIASVVPEKTAEVSKEVQRSTGNKPFVIEHAHYKGLKSRYEDISRLGIDRLCNVAYAVRNFSKNAVVIDFGSAVTFELINSSGEFEGGMILPGPRLQFEALAGGTALLPRPGAMVPGAFIGTNTEECIRSGVLYGIAGICNDFVREFRKRICARLQIVLSGGDAELFGRLVDFDHRIEKHTVPLGACIIREMNG